MRESQEKMPPTKDGLQKSDTRDNDQFKFSNSTLIVHDPMSYPKISISNANFDSWM